MPERIEEILQRIDELENFPDRGREEIKLQKTIALALLEIAYQKARSNERQEVVNKAILSSLKAN